jgi:acyl carrier protein
MSDGGKLMNDIKTQTRKFVVENFLFGDDDGFKDDAGFLESGVIDSTGILELVTWIEESFGIAVPDDELLPENLGSIDNITAYLPRKIQPDTASKTP